MVTHRNGGKVGGNVAGSISGIVLLVDVANADLILVREVDVEAVRRGVSVVEDAGSVVNFAQLCADGTARGQAVDRRAVRAARGWCGAFKLLHHTQVGRAHARSCADLSIASGGRSADKAAAERLVSGIVFVVGEEEDLVFPDRSANLAAEAVVVESRIDKVRTGLCARIRGIDGVQVAVLEILVQAAMPRVGSADQGLVELTAGGVAELGCELVLQHGEVLHRIVRDGDHRAGNRFAVVIDAFDREVVVARTLTGNGWTRSRTNAAAGGDAGVQQ